MPKRIIEPQEGDLISVVNSQLFYPVDHKNRPLVKEEPEDGIIKVVKNAPNLFIPTLSKKETKIYKNIWKQITRAYQPNEIAPQVLSYENIVFIDLDLVELEVLRKVKEQKAPYIYRTYLGEEPKDLDFLLLTCIKTVKGISVKQAELFLWNRQYLKGIQKFKIGKPLWKEDPDYTEDKIFTFLSLKDRKVINMTMGQDGEKVVLKQNLVMFRLKQN